jgi:hypothetical protein
MATIRQIDGALETLNLEQGRYPTQAEGLQALVDRPKENWTGYLKSLPKDPWGNDYIYRYPGRYKTNSFDLYSLGEDGRSTTGGNDADDINNWDETYKWSKHYNRWKPPFALFGWAIYGAVMVALLFLVKAKRDCAKTSVNTQQT